MPAQSERNQQRLDRIEMNYDGDEWEHMSDRDKKDIARMDNQFSVKSFAADECGCKFGTHNEQKPGADFPHTVFDTDPYQFADQIANLRT